MQSRMTTTCSKNLVSIYGRRTELVSNLQVDSVFLGCVPRQIGLGQGGASNGSAAAKQLALIPIRPGGRQQQNTPLKRFYCFPHPMTPPTLGASTQGFRWRPRKKFLAAFPEEASEIQTLLPRTVGLATSQSPFAFATIPLDVQKS